MQTEELLSKLDQIEEHAKHTLADFPQHLTKERQQMIIALVKHLRWEIADANRGAVEDPESTVRLPS